MTFRSPPTTSGISASTPRSASARRFEKFNLAWMEDIIPWENTELLKKITDAIEVPTCTGEDIYLKEGFINLAKNHAVDILHPDIATSGGILETHKIGDAIQEYGVPMAMHMANSPVSAYASVHVAAATENFLVLENHSVDNPNWDTSWTEWRNRSSTRASSRCRVGRDSDSN